jgi:catechol 2,3-dioxygenase-like lactoylglutathione lyase family enzyme
MSGPATLEAIAPLVPVRDPAASAAFYEQALGFRTLTLNPATRYALVGRDAARVALVGGMDAAALEATRTQIAAYIYVRDLDALWSELGPGLQALPEGRVRAPFEQSYGMREFHVKDPDGFLIFFGERAGHQGES